MTPKQSLYAGWLVAGAVMALAAIVGIGVCVLLVSEGLNAL